MSLPTTVSITAIKSASYNEITDPLNFITDEAAGLVSPAKATALFFDALGQSAEVAELSLPRQAAVAPAGGGQHEDFCSSQRPWLPPEPGRAATELLVGQLAVESDQ